MPIRAQASQLLNLPAEIRNRIWTLAVVKDDLIITGGQHCGGFNYAALPGIAQASRQARKETLPIYLWQNSFQFALFLSSKHKIDDFAGNTFGAHAEHLASMRHLRLEPTRGPANIRLTRVGDWSTVKVDCIVGGVVIRANYSASTLTPRLTRLLREAMGRNRGGQLRNADLVYLAKLVSRKLGW